MKAFVTATFDASELARLRKRMDVVHEDWRKTQKVYFSADDLIARLREVGADVLIVEADLVHEEVIEGSEVKLIGAARGDPINIGVEHATRRGIPVFFAPARNAQAVAELTVGFLLCCLRRIHEINHELRSGRMRFERTRDYLGAYERYTGDELEGKTVGIVGFGAIGQRVARAVGGFGCRVLAYDPYVEAGSFERLGAARTELDELIAQADVLTVHCPEAPATIDLVNADRVRALKPGAYVLNLARARILNEDALYEGLVSGRIAGAGLDVFVQEPIHADNRFLALPNVVVAPHYGGNTHETVVRQSRMMVDAIEDYLDGRKPKHICNPDVLSSTSRPA
jgi:D-3-phosphoglycerate dehydrogenase